MRYKKNGKLKILFYSAFFDEAMDRRLDKIIRDFPMDEVDIVFVHFNSISSPGICVQSTSTKLRCADISTYKTLNIKKIIKTERPDIIITITFMHIIDRIFISLGKILGIPVIIFQHGNITIDLPDFQKWKPGSMFSKYKKYFWYILFYIRSLSFNWNQERMKYLFHLLIRPRRYIQFYSDFNDYDSMHAVLFGKYYADFLVSLGFQKNHIYFIGTPKADKGVNLLNLKTDDHILYLSGGCIIGNLYHWNKEKERKLLSQLTVSGSKTGKKVIYRPHPLQVQKDTIEISNGLQLIISYNDEIEYLVKKSEIVVGEVSAALNEAIYQFKPIVLFKENDTIKYRFDYNTYQIGWQCDYNTIGEMLEKPETITVNKEKYKEYIEKFITFYNSDYSSDAYQLLKNIA